MKKPQLIEVLYDQPGDRYVATAPVYLAIVTGYGPSKEAAIEDLALQLQSLADQRGEMVEDLKAKVAELSGPPAEQTALEGLVAWRKSLQPIDHSPVVGPIPHVEAAEAAPSD